MSHNPIIVALDGMALPSALSLVSRLSTSVWGYKLNDLFMCYGWEAVREIRHRNNAAKIMLDMKLYDIPNTVKNHCEAIKLHDNIDIVTVHAHGGVDMMKAATSVIPNGIAAVTVLTSFNQNTYGNLHRTTSSIEDAVVSLAGHAQFAGCSHLVCSGNELLALRRYGITLKTIVPGIRPKWHVKSDDQKRTMTPEEAVAAGADYLVIGRPIIEAKDPVKAVADTLLELGMPF